MLGVSLRYVSMIAVVLACASSACLRRPEPERTTLRLAAQTFANSENTVRLSWVEVTAPPPMLAANDWIRECAYGSRSESPAAAADFARAALAQPVADKSKAATPVARRIERTINVVYQSKKQVSFACTQTESAGGVATARTFYASFRMADGKRLELEDLLQPGGLPALLSAGESALRKARRIPVNRELAQVGLVFPNGRFALTTNFCLTARGMVFHYNPGELGNAQTEAVEVVISPLEIRPLLRPGAAYLVDR